MNVLNILLYGDENYFFPMKTTVSSMMDSLEKGRMLSIYILCVNFSLDMKTDIERELVHGSKIKWIDCETSEYEKIFLRKINHLSYCAYLKLNFIKICPEISGRVLILDSDVLIVGSMHEIFEIDLEGKVIGACLDTGVIYTELVNEGMFSGIDNNAQSSYFNSGVVLVDVDKWKKVGVFEKICELAKKYDGQYRYDDQCLLNYLFINNWKQIDLCWNVQRAQFSSRTFKFCSINEKSYFNSFINPKIFHFTTARKPWDGFKVHKGAYIYRQYLEKYNLKFNYGVIDFAREYVMEIYNTTRFLFKIKKVTSRKISIPFELLQFFINQFKYSYIFRKRAVLKK